MIEVSITEIVLFAWGFVMTALYFKTRQEEHMVRTVFMYEEFVRAYTIKLINSAGIETYETA